MVYVQGEGSGVTTIEVLNQVDWLTDKIIKCYLVEKLTTDYPDPPNEMRDFAKISGLSNLSSI